MNQVTKRPPPGTIMDESAVFADDPYDYEDLSSGVAVSFPILGIKGGKFHYRWKGEDNIIPLEPGSKFPAPAINVVILKAQRELSRTLYPPGSYVDGDNKRPACWSSDGVKPDDAVPDPVNPVCATCPKDAWGSGATPASPKAKACQQRRRVVVVPYADDLSNAEQGGPVLLSVPPGSLRNLDEYSGLLKTERLRYYGCITQLSFDQETAFPRLEFSWAQKLNDDEARQVRELRIQDQVDRIINSKITIDGPEVEGPDEPVATHPSTSSGPPRAAPQPNTPRAAVQPAIPRAAQQPIVQAPAQPKKTMVGGFAAAGAPITPAPISSAMARPAAPPPSARTVRAAPQPQVEPSAGEVLAEDRTHGTVPDELNDAFGKLMQKP